MYNELNSLDFFDTPKKQEPVTGNSDNKHLSDICNYREMGVRKVYDGKIKSLFSIREVLSFLLCNAVKDLKDRNITKDKNIWIIK